MGGKKEKKKTKILWYVGGNKEKKIPQFYDMYVKTDLFLG